MRFAASGYAGGGRKTAVPLRTPPDTGLRIGFGPGLGGGSESNITRISSLGSTAPTFSSVGPVASLVAVFEADGRSGAFGIFLLSLFAFAGVFTFGSGLFAGVVAGGVTGCGVVAAPGVTIRTMFSSR